MDPTNVLKTTNTLPNLQRELGAQNGSNQSPTYFERVAGGHKAQHAFKLGISIISKNQAAL